MRDPFCSGKRWATISRWIDVRKVADDRGSAGKWAFELRNIEIDFQVVCHLTWPYMFLGCGHPMWKGWSHV